MNLLNYNFKHIKFNYNFVFNFKLIFLVSHKRQFGHVYGISCFRIFSFLPFLFVIFEYILRLVELVRVLSVLGLDLMH